MTIWDELVEPHTRSQAQQTRMRAIEKAGAEFLQVLAANTPEGENQKRAVNRVQEAVWWAKFGIVWQD